MIIDTHFHAFPGKFLELMPEAKTDVRGVGFHAFDHREYLNVMDRYGIDIGVLSNTGGRIEKVGTEPKLWISAKSSMTPSPMLMRNIRIASKPSRGCR